jgi:hypothetical protein
MCTGIIKEYRPSPRIQRSWGARKRNESYGSFMMSASSEAESYEKAQTRRRRTTDWLTEIEKNSTRVCVVYLMCNALLSAVTQKRAKEKMHCIKWGYIHNNALSHNQRTVKSRTGVEPERHECSIDFCNALHPARLGGSRVTIDTLRPQRILAN